MTVADLLGHPFGVPEPRAASLAAELERSKELGFLGPGPVVDHVRHAVPLAELLPRCALVVDLGAGGGVPGLVLLVARPDLRLVLLDSMARRCSFLRGAVANLGADERVEVAEGRAEALAREPVRRHRADVVVARSFGSPPVTAECAAGFVRVGGRIWVSEPPDDREERWPVGPLADLGLSVVGRHHGLGTTLVEISVDRECDDDVPRRDGVPAKRPRW